MKLTRRHFDAMVGSEITRTIEAAIELASDDANGVEFEFNGVTVHVNSNSNPVLLYREWNRAMRAGHKGPVGPYPAAELTAKELADDAEITAAIEARQRASQQEYMLEMAARRATAERKLEGDRGLRLNDPEGWEKTRIATHEPYAVAILTYAERWGRLMQVELANGNNLADIAKSCAYEADIEGITGFMYGKSVAVLSQFWIHGEELRRWHNASYGEQGKRANEKGGVINPAVLTIGVDAPE